MFKNNRIYKIDKNGKRRRVFFIKGLFVKFKGKNSIIELHEPCIKFRFSKITCGDNCKITFKPKGVVRKLEIFATGEGSECHIGEDFGCTENCSVILNMESGKKVTIGDNCMFGSNILIRTSDGHSIIDCETEKTLNFGGDIKIGNHCWLATNVTVLKGAQIADNSVIGYGSIVTKNCVTPNSVYVGNPAKMVKTNINWDRKAPER